MDSNINVTSLEIANALGQFQGEMQKMELLFESIKKETSLVNGYWQGQASDDALRELTNFMKVFEDVSSQNEKYVSFLNGVIDKYTTTEKGISESIDTAASTGLGINGSGI